MTATLSEQLTDYVNAAFTGLWVHTREPDEAQREVAALAHEHSWTLATWDVAAGLHLLSASDTARTDAGPGDPLAPLNALPGLARDDGTALLLLHHYHKFLNSPEVVQTLFARLIAGKQDRTFVVVLAPVVQIPVELEKLFVVLDHPLPDRVALERIARELTSDSPADLPQGLALQQVLDAAAGLTRYEAEGAFALSLTRHNALRPQAIREVKAQTLRKDGLLRLHRGEESLDDLGGLAALKAFCLRALAHRPLDAPARPRGILLLSPPGCGKSQFCKALGNAVGRPTLLLDAGSLLGSLVGQSEANLRQALRTVDAMAPAVCMVDELEKALAGVGGQGDSGVTTRLFGTLLTYLSDHDSDVFFVATSNDITRLPAELARAERFDGVFFLDLPSREEKDVIWGLYRRQFRVPEGQARPEDPDWTGAEIRSCCRLAALLDMSLEKAAEHVVPVAVTAAEQVDKLRSWADGRCLAASAGGIYRRVGAAATPPVRRVRRNPENN
jgi:hypothetical protein